MVYFSLAVIRGSDNLIKSVSLFVCPFGPNVPADTALSQLHHGLLSKAGVGVYCDSAFNFSSRVHRVQLTSLSSDNKSFFVMDNRACPHNTAKSN